MQIPQVKQFSFTRIFSFQMPAREDAQLSTFCLSKNKLRAFQSNPCLRFHILLEWLIEPRKTLYLCWLKNIVTSWIFFIFFCSSLSHVQLFATPRTILPGFSVHGILQARILEWAAIPFSRGSSRPRDRSQVSCITGRFFTGWATVESLFGGNV